MQQSVVILIKQLELELELELFVHVVMSILETDS